jgi:MFS family permease
VLNILATQRIRQRVDMRSHRAVTRVLLVADALLALSVIGFALAGAFWQAVVAFIAVSLLRSLSGPLFTAWLNQQVTDPAVRATVLSMSGQADALGQFAGGPVIGAIANRFAIRTALTIAGCLLAPSLPLYLSALRHPTAEHNAPTIRLDAKSANDAKKAVRVTGAGRNTAVFALVSDQKLSIAALICRPAPSPIAGKGLATAPTASDRLDRLVEIVPCSRSVQPVPHNRRASARRTIAILMQEIAEHLKPCAQCPRAG